MPKVIKERSIGGEDTHLYSDMDMIQIERESHTKAFVEKTKELTDKVIEILGRKKTAWESIAEDVVLPYKILCKPYEFRTAAAQLYGSIPHVWEVVQSSRSVMSFSWGCPEILSGTASPGLGDLQ